MYSFIVDSVTIEAELLLSVGIVSTIAETEDGYLVEVPGIDGLMVEDCGTEWYDKLTLTVDPTRVQAAKIVVRGCPRMTVRVIHTRSMWIVSESTCQETGVCYINGEPTGPHYAGVYQHYDFLPAAVKKALKLLVAFGGVGAYWHDAGIIDVVKNIPDNKGWRPVRDMYGKLIRVESPKGRWNDSPKFRRKIPKHLRKELNKNQKIKEVSSAISGPGGYSIHQDTMSWERSTYNPM